MKRIICILVVLCAVQQPLWGKTAKRKAAQLPRTAELRLKRKLIEKAERKLPDQRAAIESIFNDPRFGLLPSPTAPKKEYKHVRGVNYFFQEPVYMLSEESWRRGREYMEKHADTLASAEEEYGVPKEIIVAILRVETYLGKGLDDDKVAADSLFNRGLGVHPAINTLYTKYVKRSGRILKKRPDPAKEMICLIEICFKNSWDVFAIPGSSDGAIGIPQFMPTSYMNPKFVADGDGDGKIDLFSHDDAIMSSAKYLSFFHFGRTLKSKKKAIWAYNHSRPYVDAVLIYAELLGKSEYDEKWVKKFTESQQTPPKKKKRASATP